MNGRHSSPDDQAIRDHEAGVQLGTIVRGFMLALLIMAWMA